MDNIKIYYSCFINGAKSDQEFILNKFLSPTKVTRKQFKDYYRLIYEKNDTVTEIDQYLNSLFELFNSEHNPLCRQKYQNLIKNLNSHTTMGVGDVVRINDQYYIVASFGFEKIF